MNNRIVSIGLLTEEDIARLGVGFTRHFPVVDDDLFAGLIEKLDQITEAARPSRDVEEPDG